MANTVQYLLANMGHIALLLGDADRAERHFAEASVAAHELGADGSPLAALGEGLLARHRGDLTGARAPLLRRPRHARPRPRCGTGPRPRPAGSGFVAELTGDLATAEHRHRQAYQLATDVGHVGAAARAAAVEGMACVAAARGDGQAAATLLGTAARWRARAHRPATPLELHDIERAADRARALLGPAAYERPGRPR